MKRNEESDEEEREQREELIIYYNIFKYILFALMRIR